MTSQGSQWDVKYGKRGTGADHHAYEKSKSLSHSYFPQCLTAFCFCDWRVKVIFSTERRFDYNNNEGSGRRVLLEPAFRNCFIWLEAIKIFRRCVCHSSWGLFRNISKCTRGNWAIRFQESRWTTPFQKGLTYGHKRALPNLIHTHPAGDWLIFLVRAKRETYQIFPAESLWR